MKIQKQKTSHIGNRTERRIYNEFAYAKRHIYSLLLNARARDFILPYRHVNYEVLDESRLLLTPTNDEDGYKLSIAKNGSASITWCHAEHFFSIPENEVCPITFEDDGSLILHVRSRSEA